MWLKSPSIVEQIVYVLNSEKVDGGARPIKIEGAAPRTEVEKVKQIKADLQ